jgi:chromatin remodeling complex protein RSC6
MFGVALATSKEFLKLINEDYYEYVKEHELNNCGISLIGFTTKFYVDQWILNEIFLAGFFQNPSKTGHQKLNFLQRFKNPSRFSWPTLMKNSDLSLNQPTVICDTFLNTYKLSKFRKAIQMPQVLNLWLNIAISFQNDTSKSSKGANLISSVDIEIEYHKLQI